MNGPNSMYKMRPILKLSEEIDLPKCMYKMKVIQSSHCDVHSESITNNTLESKILEQMPLPEVAALELRQELILSQLAELKEQLTMLRGELKRTSHDTNTCAANNMNDTQWKECAPQEIVINANPVHPPYSLLAFNSLVHNAINIHSHVHSAVKSMPESLVEQFNRTALEYPALNIRLIWKNVPDLELLLCPTKHTVICGEVNMLRFLSRIGPLHLDYEISNSVLEAEVCDEVLDTCYKLVRETTAKARLAILRVLGTYLQKCQFFMGPSITIADMAAWSALKQMGFTTKELTVNMNKWFAICNEKFCD